MATFDHRAASQAPLRGGALDRVEHARAGQHLLDARLALLAVADRGEEGAGLEHAQVVVAHRHAGPGLEGGEVGVLRAGEDRRVALVPAVVGELEALELVHPLELPGQRAAGAVDLEAHLHARADDHPARLQRADRAAAELEQRARPVLVVDVDEVVALRRG